MLLSLAALHSLPITWAEFLRILLLLFDSPVSKAPKSLPETVI